MIGVLKGKIILKESNYIILDVNGIGFQIFMTEYDIARFTENNVILYTHTHIREDVIELFGFIESHCLYLFKMLIGVSGLGPRGALNILGSSTPNEVIGAIINEDKVFLKSLPGIGAKSAAKLIIELKDRLFVKNRELIASEKKQTDNSVNDAIEALKSLGYSSKEAQELVSNVTSETDKPLNTGEIVSNALKIIAQNR